MMPCMRLYAWLGQQLARRQQQAHPYSDWITTYSSADFDQLATRLERLLDRYTPDTPIASETYRYAMQCETDFFRLLGGLPEPRFGVVGNESGRRLPYTSQIRLAIRPVSPVRR